MNELVPGAIIDIDKEERLFKLKAFITVVKDNQQYFDEVCRKMEYEHKLELESANYISDATYATGLQYNLDTHAAAYRQSRGTAFEERQQLYRMLTVSVMQIVDTELEKVLRAKHTWTRCLTP